MSHETPPTPDHTTEQEPQPKTAEHGPNTTPAQEAPKPKAGPLEEEGRRARILEELNNPPSSKNHPREEHPSHGHDSHEHHHTEEPATGWKLWKRRSGNLLTFVFGFGFFHTIYSMSEFIVSKIAKGGGGGGGGHSGGHSGGDHGHGGHH